MVDQPEITPEATPLWRREWERYADLLLQRTALVARVDRNRAPDPLAGLKVDDADIDHLLRELPGLEGRDEEASVAIDRALEGSMDEARARFLASLGGEGSFASLARHARLSPSEAEVLAVLCAVEADPRRQRLAGYLNDDITQRRLTPWSLGLLTGAPETAVAAIGPGGGLRRAALLGPLTDVAWGTAPIAVAPPVLWWLYGDRFFDPDLPAGVTTVAGPGSGTEVLVVASGPDRLRRLQAVASALEPSSFLVTSPPQTPAQWEGVIRQATLGGLGVVIEAGDDLAPEARDRIDRADHLAWAIISTNDLPVMSLPQRPWFEVSVTAPLATASEWEGTFPDEQRSGYRLTADQLHQVVRVSKALGGDLPGAVRRLAAGHVDATATRLRPTRTWDDLVLDKERQTQVREIAIRARHRDTVFETWGFSPQPSTGVVALFAGPSGTGKTLAAEIIASELGIDLYKIDLANLVSKYIGETEQNLSKVFAAAEASNVALFFDEADALLGKRSEVSDAHDRYANIEVAYLLQRLERYEGVAVLATNLLKNIDPAFLRRIHVVVEFPMPEAPERRRIWARSIPPGAPVAADLDLDALADSVEISGGTIRNAVMSAAFLAAEAGSPISMELATLALRRELMKIGRLVTGPGLGV